MTLYEESGEEERNVECAKTKQKPNNFPNSISPSVSSEHCSNHILHVKVARDACQEHVKPRIMAETDVSRLRTEGERGTCFGYGINLPFGTGAERSGCRHNKSYVTCNSTPPPIQLHSTLGTCNWLIHTEKLCQRYAFTPVLLFPVMRDIFLTLCLL